ncbi:MAG: GtrA family protein [Dechloromonas sp.]|nr:GtrA family protein [Dechloromonas sp.]
MMAIRLKHVARHFAPERVIGQFMRFAGVGVVAMAIQYSILIALVHQASVRAPYASSVGFLLSAFANYFLNYRFTFRSDQPHAPAIAKFFSVAAVGLVLNHAVMAIATDWFAFHYLLAQIVATVLVLLWNFSVSRLWTFRAG